MQLGIRITVFVLSLQANHLNSLSPILLLIKIRGTY